MIKDLKDEIYSERKKTFEDLLTKYNLFISDILLEREGDYYIVNICYIDSLFKSKPQHNFDILAVIDLFLECIELELDVETYPLQGSVEEFKSLLRKLGSTRNQVRKFVGSFGGLENEGIIVIPNCSCPHFDAILNYGYKPIIKASCKVHRI